MTTTTTPTVWKAPFQVNDAVTNVPPFTNIVALKNGNFLVTWTDENDLTAPGQAADTVGALYDLNGNIIKSPFQLNITQSSGDQQYPGVAPTADGGFVVVHSKNNGNDRRDLTYDRYDADGELNAQDPGGFIFSSQLIGAPSVTTLGDGSFMVAYEASIDGTVENSGVHFVTVDPLGQVSVQTRIVLDGSPHTLRENAMVPNITTMPNGDVLGTFITRQTDSPSSDVKVWVFQMSPNGQNFTSTITAVNVDYFTRPHAEPLADGGFVVVWDYQRSVAGRLYEDIHTPPTKFGIHSNDVLIPQSDVVALDDGGFYVAWANARYSNSFYGTIEGRRFDKDGNVIGTTVSPNIPYNGYWPELSATEDGRILVAWNADEDISAMILDPRDTDFTLDGTIGSVTTQVTDSVVEGSVEDDTVFGQAGDDDLRGNAGNDNLNGGDGDDILKGGLGNNMLDGGPGLDLVDYRDATAAATLNVNHLSISAPGLGTDAITSIEGFLAGAFNDRMYGNDDANYFEGNDGNDLITAFGGNDTLIGGNGNDRMYGGPDDDVLDGGDGTDTLQGGSGSDTQHAGAGNDRVYVDGDDLAANTSGGDGSDRLIGLGNVGINFDLAATGFESAFGTRGGDQLDGSGLSTRAVLIGQNGDDVLTGGSANDLIQGKNDNDTASGGMGDDYITGDNGNDAVSGDDGADRLFGGAGDDIINGGAGNDLIDGGAGIDNLKGGDGDDDIRVDSADTNVSGGAGYDTLRLQDLGPFHFMLDAATSIERAYGNNGPDTFDASASPVGVTIYAIGGDDIIYDSAFDDRLVGEQGDDIMYFSGGNDAAYGGPAGNDIAVFGGNQADYTIEGNDIAARVTNIASGDVVRLSEFDTLQFSDGSIAL